MNTGTVRLRKWTSSRPGSGCAGTLTQGHARGIDNAALPLSNSRCSRRRCSSSCSASRNSAGCMANYVMVTNAASSGARYFAAQRGTATPYTATKTQVVTSAAYLTTGNLSITTYVNGTQCTSDSDCATDLSAAANAPATVTVTYSSFSPLFKGKLAGLVGMPASLNSTMVERVQ